MGRNSSTVSNTDDPAVYVGRVVICLSVHVGWKLEKGLYPWEAEGSGRCLHCGAFDGKEKQL